MQTDTRLRALKPKAKLYRVADANGLCVEVRPNGARLWRYRYRHAGKASMIGLALPAVSLAAARRPRIDYYPSADALAAIEARSSRYGPTNNYSGILDSITAEWSQAHNPTQAETDAPAAVR